MRWDGVNWIQLAEDSGSVKGSQCNNLQVPHKTWDGLSRQTAGLSRQTDGFSRQTAGLGRQTAGLSRQTAGLGRQTAIDHFGFRLLHRASLPAVIKHKIESIRIKLHPWSNYNFNFPAKYTLTVEYLYCLLSLIHVSVHTLPSSGRTLCFFSKTSAYFFLIKPTDALISQIYFCQETLHVSGSSSAHHQEFSTVHSALV